MLCATQAVAFDYPALFKVIDVAADDYLHAREQPDAGSFSIGVYSPTAANIEVVRLSENGRWGQVNYDERTAWVSMRFLERTSPVTGPYPSVTCFGTEPFWSYDMDISTHRSAARFQSMGGQPVELGVRSYQPSENRTDRTLFVTGPRRMTPFFSLTAIVSEALCTDGMSDRTYGLTVDLTIFAEGPSRFLSGCCSVEPR